MKSVVEQEYKFPYIGPHSLKDQTLTGTGSFGCIYKATWISYGSSCNSRTENLVTIKVLYNSPKSAVYDEAKRLQRLQHDNIVRFLGLVPRGANAPWLVMEDMPIGDLQRYLWSKRTAGGICAYGMVKIAHSIACGMEYLHSQNSVHGDLAARNCLVGCPEWHVKIGDLGFYDSANTHAYSYYYKNPVPCPVRWMPPENLPYRLNRNGKVVPCEPFHVNRTYVADVWSFGVVLFEIWARGETPFYGFDNYEACRTVLQGNVPTKFKFIHVRQHVAHIMNLCWQYNARNRPTFAMIREHFEAYEGLGSENDL